MPLHIALDEGQVTDASPVQLSLVEQLPEIHHPEGYVLTASTDGVTIQATTKAGLFYGQQTLKQLQTADGKIPVGTVVDEPRFDYRGLMLDVSRHFFDTEFIKKQIDAMACYKLNRLHLHLTDAAGWRIEIKRYPKLTGLAAWREYATRKEWSNNERTYVEEGTPGAYGGYFTQEQIRELVAYAAERHITIIPEIEMPSHSEEVLTAYPELSCTHEPYKQSDFCIGNEKTFEFLQNVLLEVMELFPSPYIHIGGDEAGKSSWKTCPLCQARMKREGLKNVDELQSYLIHRIDTFLTAHGRRLVGWDEILDGGLSPNATVMSWRGTEGGLKAAAAGHDAIMTPGEFCYFDSYQDAPHSQPEAIGGYLPLKKVYAYNPAPDTLSAEQAARIRGVQANLWAEYIPTPEHMEHMIYPRLLALSEVAWSAAERKEYADFHRRALRAVEELKEKGYNSFDLKNEIGNRPGADEPIAHLAVGKPVLARLYSRWRRCLDRRYTGRLELQRPPLARLLGPQGSGCSYRPGYGTSTAQHIGRLHADMWPRCLHACRSGDFRLDRWQGIYRTEQNTQHGGEGRQGQLPHLWLGRNGFGALRALSSPAQRLRRISLCRRGGSSATRRVADVANTRRVRLPT